MEFWFIFLFTISLNPLLMIITLILILVFMVLALVFCLGGYFYSYIVFLLFMSGLIMMLMYFCSVILNEKFILFSDFIILLIFLFLFDYLSFSSDYLNLFSDLKLFYFEFNSLLKYLIYSYTVYSLFFICYLLFCLIVVYEIVKKCGGPLRMKT